MLTYISDVGDENLVNVFINLDGQDLTIRMQREVHREVENLFLYYSVMILDSQDL